MKRVAIILGSPYPEDSSGHLRGVSADVENYKRFLMSSSGGAWFNNEIHTGIHITKSKVETIQRLCDGADIALIIYSGHGYMTTGQNFLNINPHQSLNVSQLVTTAKRQITIIDACRTDYPYDHFDGIGDPFGFYFDNTNKEIGRAIYDFYIKNSPEGSFTVFSSSANQASEDTENGGRFSTSLLNCLSSWAIDSNSLCMTVENAFHCACESLENEFAEQIPEAFYTGGQVPSFPFCVSPKAYLAKYGKPAALSGYRMQSKQPSRNIAGPILVSIAATLVIASLLSD